MIAETKYTIETLIATASDSGNDTTALRLQEAYNFAINAHQDRVRESGERYIDHDLAVARELLQLMSDSKMLVVALLHDSLLPHTNLTSADIEEAFGEEIADLVSSFNRIQTFAQNRTYTRRNSEKESLENVRQSILSLVENDVRVVLLRIVDSLQDLRTARNLELVKQRQIAWEAMRIYAPLANRLGIWSLKSQLEDTAFQLLHPDKSNRIMGQLAAGREEREERIERAAEKLREKIRDHGLKAIVEGRPKHIYSIYRKMQRKNLPFSEVYDVQALRVILQPNDPNSYEGKSLKEKEELDRTLCYLALGSVHSLWQPIPQEFDDYIASPKPNGYQSLHTAVMEDDKNHRLEVQIRTERMHEAAEKGIAAHWAYKEIDTNLSASSQRRLRNLRELTILLKEGEGESDNDNDSLLDSVMMPERVYVYAPNGRVFDLPTGSTPIDFAYQVHSEVGHNCRSARVNGKQVSLDYKLQPGDHVEIVKANRGGPNRDWMNASLGYTGSARTRSKIRQWFRKQERGKNIAQGREVVERELKHLNLRRKITVEDIAKKLNLSVEEFLAKVGFGDIQSKQLSGAIALIQRDFNPNGSITGEDEELRPLLIPDRPKSKGLTIMGASGLPTKLGRCCNPIPPQEIVGYITRGRGITIHRDNCKHVDTFRERKDKRLIEDVDWGLDEDRHPVPIVVKAYRRANLIDEMSNILRGQRINAPKTKTITSDTMITIYLVAEVKDMEQLAWLLNKFENLRNVIEAKRQYWD